MKTGGLKREVVIFGLGHIGASLAAALSARGWKVWGWDRNPAAVRYCRREGWVYHVARDEVPIEGHELICVIAIPESAHDDPKVKLMLAQLPHGTIVTDVFSSKGRATEELARVCGAHGLRFGWSHPLAGREGQGAASADPTIFKHARALVDSGAPRAVRLALGRFWQALDCEVAYLSTGAHQKRMAAGSHLMHAVAYSLMHAIGSTDAGSPSVLGATRVAKSSPDAWAAILMSNRAEVLASVKRLQRELATTSRLLRAGRGLALQKHLASAQSLRLEMEKKK